MQKRHLVPQSKRWGLTAFSILRAKGRKEVEGNKMDNQDDGKIGNVMVTVMGALGKGKEP